MQTNTRISPRLPNDHSSDPPKKPEQTTSPSAVAPFLSFFLLLSATVNIVFLSGCRSVHDLVYGNPCEYQTRSTETANGPAILVEDGSTLRTKLTKLASIAKVDVGEKSNDTLAGDIVKELEAENRRKDDRIKVLQEIDSADLDGRDVESKAEDELIEDIQERIRDLKTKNSAMMERSSAKVPSPFPGFEEMTEILSTSQETAMRSYHTFIKELQGKRVIVLDPED